MNKTKYFTLIELLVVISIISILASMLLPNLKRALESAKGLSCLNNQRSIVQAFSMWSEDNDGWVPPITWQQRLTEYGIAWDSTSGPRSGEVLNCPADTSSFWQAPTSSIATYSGYALNAALAWSSIGPGGTGDGVSPWGTDNVYYTTHGNCRISQVKKASTYIYTMDSIGYANANPQSGTFFDNFRHTSGSNVNIAWMDGHASSSGIEISESQNTGAPLWHTYYPAFYP